MRGDFFENRKRKSRLKLWPWLLGLFLLGLLVIGSLYLVLYSDILKVKSIKVEGADIIYQSSLLRSLIPEIIAKSKLKGWLGPENLLFWGNQSLKSVRNLATLKMIKIKTDLFQKKADIQFEERKLKGIWCLVSFECYGFDGEGIVFIKAPEPEGVLILKIDDENQRQIVIGHSVFNDLWFKNILVTLRDLDESGWEAVSVRVRDLKLEEWEMKTPAGLAIYFSLNFVPEDLGSIMKNLKDRLSINKLTYLDFRVPSRIYYK